MRRRPSDAALSVLREHAALEKIHEDGDAGDFLSGWQCQNPFRDLIDEAVSAARMGLAGNRYYYLEDDKGSLEQISELHVSWGEERPQALIPSMGSTPLLFAFCAYLRDIGVSEIFYVPPLYFGLHAALQLAGMRARPISGSHGFEAKFDPNIPDRRCVLMLCDPVWYAGTSLSEAFVDRLRTWQATTGSTIFVDGSFQYMKWSGSIHEHTSRLDPNLTVRVICPTKALAAHAYRFAYAIVPGSMRVDLAHVHTRMHGSSSIDSIAMARVAARLVGQRIITRGLLEAASEAHRRLRAAGRISAPWHPDAGYFVFERLDLRQSRGMLLMGQRYFEQARFPDYARINLLSPSIASLR